MLVLVLVLVLAFEAVLEMPLAPAA
jgi:hypothetical protein